MHNEQRLLEKWRVLSPEKQQEILVLLDRVDHQEMENQSASGDQSPMEEQEKPTFQPQTERGKKFWDLRQKALRTQTLLNSWEEIEEELAERRGGVRE